MDLVYSLLIGLAAGWLAGLFLKGSGFGWLGNLIVGALGALLGGFLFALVGLTSSGLLGRLICATVGAVVLLALLQFVAKKK